MKFNLSSILWTLVCCLFVGVIIISVGLGSVFPAIDRVARPFVCPNGEMKYVQRVYRPTPVETITTTSWFCVDERTGAETELGVFPLSMASGAVYGLVLFVAALIFMAVSHRRLATNLELLAEKGGVASAELLERLGVQDKPQVTGRAAARMKELQELREAGLISELEYAQKRAEILKEL